MRPALGFLMLALLAAGLAACRVEGPSETELARFPVDDLDGVVDRSLVALDTDHTSDGGGSVRLDVDRPTTFRLFEVSGIEVEEARLVYRAQLRAEELDGRAFLEMWCRFPGQGEYFSRALHAPLSGSVEWVVQETPFFLQAGQRPDLVRLNVAVDGSGTVWVDEVTLVKAPLEPR